MDIVNSGIIGLDRVLSGGFQTPSTILVAGTAGTGKTSFIMQSMFNSAAAGERVCVFIPILSEPPAMINGYMAQFGFYDHSLYERRKIIFYNIREEHLEDPQRVIDFISQKLEKTRATRIAIDPINALTLTCSELEARKCWYDLFARLKGWGVCALVTGEYTQEQLMTNTISYLVDGIIHLGTIEREGKTQRFLQICKMRGMGHDINKRSIEIGPNGIEVLGNLYD